MAMRVRIYYDVDASPQANLQCAEHIVAFGFASLIVLTLFSRQTLFLSV